MNNMVIHNLLKIIREEHSKGITSDELNDLIFSYIAKLSRKDAEELLNELKTYPNRKQVDPIFDEIITYKIIRKSEELVWSRLMVGIGFE